MAMPPFRYAVLLLALGLFGFASGGYSQDADNQARQEQNSAEPSTEEPNPLETRFKHLENQFKALQNRFNAMGNRPNDSENPPSSRFQTFVVIFIVLVILAFAGVVVFGLRIVQKHRRISDDRADELQQRFDRRTEELQTSLDYLRQVGKDNADKLEEAESKHTSISSEQENIHKAIADIKAHINDVDLTLANLESDREIDSLIEEQREAETIVQDAQEQVAALARAYREGEPIDLDDIETPTPSQNALIILNSMVRDLRQWKTEAARAGQADPNLIDTLTYREADIRDKLKEIRGDFPPTPKPLQVQTDVSTEAELNEIRKQCAVHVARFEGTLSGYEQGREVDLAEYNKFIPQFIEDRLFNGVARFVEFDRLPEHVDKFLQLVGYEIVPIEIGITKADARVHEIQGSRHTGAEPGSVVEVVSPGLKRITDGEIVQKPVVIRGE